MKINVEIDLEWIDEDYTVDDVVKQQIVKSVAAQLEDRFTGKVKSDIADAAEKLVTAKTEQLIYSMLEKPVTVSSGWGSSNEYDSIYDMVEQRMTSLYEGKLNTSGKCEKDPLLANIEKYVENHISTKIRGIETLIDRHAKKHAADALKQSNLVQSLRAVIPEIDKEVVK